MQDQQNPKTAHFPTRVILAIAVGKKLDGVRLCDLEKVIRHIVPKRDIRFHQIEKYAMQVIRYHVQQELPFLKDIQISAGETDDQFVSYYEGLYGETLPLEGGDGAMLLSA